MPTYSSLVHESQVRRVWSAISVWWAGFIVLLLPDHEGVRAELLECAHCQPRTHGLGASTYESYEYRSGKSNFKIKSRLWVTA